MSDTRRCRDLPDPFLAEIFDHESHLTLYHPFQKTDREKEVKGGPSSTIWHIKIMPIFSGKIVRGPCLRPTL